MGKALTIRRLGENFRSAGIDLRRLGQSPRPIPAMLEIPGTNCPEDRRNGLEL